MRMEYPFWMRLSIKWSLVKPHGIREGDFEQIVVTGSDRFQNLCQRGHFGGGQFRQAGQVGTMGTQENLEGPDCPKRNPRREMIIGGEDALFAFMLLGEDIGKQGPPVSVEIGG